jgi:hypothetical protein
LDIDIIPRSSDTTIEIASVSEERGIISIAKNGKLKESLNIDELEDFLQKSLRN